MRRSTQVVTIDLQTEFFIDFYVQDNKVRLEEKVRLDGQKDVLKRRYGGKIN